MHGQVAHPLQLADHAQRGDHRAQVARNRLLQREQQERRVLDALAGAVDVVVRADHLLGDRRVAAEQRLGRQADGGLDALADTGKVTEHPIELIVEGLSHGEEPRWARCTTGVNA